MKIFLHVPIYIHLKHNQFLPKIIQNLSLIRAMRKKDRQSCKMVSSFFRSMLTFFSQLKTPKHGLLSILSLICPAQTRPFILIKILNCFGGHVEMSLVSKLARPFTAHHWITGYVLLSQDTKDLIILNTFFI